MRRVRVLLAAGPGRGQTENQDRGSQSRSAHGSRVGYPSHKSLSRPLAEKRR